jgi:hypothetical protein
LGSSRHRDTFSSTLVATCIAFLFVVVVVFLCFLGLFAVSVRY